uniref:Secreted protein n=1 Tax=Panagrellus redivivus TaxID=6233 RepID=A0A7E4WCS3_PANRE
MHPWGRRFEVLMVGTSVGRDHYHHHAWPLGECLKPLGSTFNPFTAVFGTSLTKRQFGGRKTYLFRVQRAKRDTLLLLEVTAMSMLSVVVVATPAGVG